MLNLDYYPKITALSATLNELGLKYFWKVALREMQICSCTVLLQWTGWNCCTLKTCSSPAIHIHTQSFYFPLTVNMSASPLVIHFEVKFKNGKLLVFQGAVGEVGVF